MTKASDNEFPSVLFGELASAPTTPAAGKWRLFTKSDGLYIVDDSGGVTGPLAAAAAGYTQGARVYNNANISIANATVTKLTFNSERYDTDTIHDTSSNTGRLTCKTAGKYIISFSYQWQAGSAGFRYVDIFLNNTTPIASHRNNGENHEGEATITTIYDLAVNDYLEVRVYQNNGTALNIVAVGNVSPEFMMQRIG